MSPAVRKFAAYSLFGVYMLYGNWQIGWYLASFGLTELQTGIVTGVLSLTAWWLAKAVANGRFSRKPSDGPPKADTESLVTVD